MLELRDVGHDGMQRINQCGLDGDGRAKQPAQHRRERVGDVRKVHGCHRQHLSAAEGEQLPCQCRGPLGGRLDLLKVLADRFVRSDLIGQQFGVTQNGGEHVVEVVRDTTGQLADRLHFLRLAKLFLEPLLLGDVLDNHFEHAPTRQPLLGESATEPNPDFVAVRSFPDDLFAGEAPLLAAPGRHIRVAIRAGVEVSDTRIQQLLGGFIPQHRDQRGVDGDEAVVNRGLVDPKDRVFDERSGTAPLRRATLLRHGVGDGGRRRPAARARSRERGAQDGPSRGSRGHPP